MSHWCEYCQVEHSSMSCYHPAVVRLKALEQRIAELEAEVRRWAENSEKNGTAMTQARNDLAELQRKYDALVERVESAQSHTRETLRLLQWDQLGWDVPEEVIESLGKADSELRALLEDE